MFLFFFCIRVLVVDLEGDHVSASEIRSANDEDALGQTDCEACREWLEFV